MSFFYYPLYEIDTMLVIISDVLVIAILIFTFCVLVFVLTFYSSILFPYVTCFLKIT